MNNLNWTFEFRNKVIIRSRSYGRFIITWGIMKFLKTLSIIFILAITHCYISDNVCAEPTAKEILQKVAEQGFKDSFRAVLTIKTTKGKKSLSDQTVWVIGKLKDRHADFFFDFTEPEESKGLRFLLQVRDNQEPKAFMYLPSTGKTLPLATEDPSTDIGGTGINMDDIMGFVPKVGETEKILGNETVDGQECWVVQITRPDQRSRTLWIRKKDYTMIRSQEADSAGKVKRDFRVVEFFRTVEGKDYPREEHIVVPDKNVKIIVRQENAVFGIDIPVELLDPARFGQHKWKD